MDDSFDTRFVGFEDDDDETPAPPRPWLEGRKASLVMLLASALVAGAVAWRVLPTVGAEFIAMEARDMLDTWQGNPQATWTPRMWERARDDLMHAARMTPDDASLYDSLAALMLLRAVREDTPEAEQAELYTLAIGYQLMSVRIRPAHAQAWTNLALARYNSGAAPEESQAAWRTALALGRHDLNVWPQLAQLLMIHWEESPPDMQAWLLGVYNEAEPALQEVLQALAAQSGAEGVLPALPGAEGETPAEPEGETAEGSEAEAEPEPPQTEAEAEAPPADAPSEPAAPVGRPSAAASAP